MRSWRVLILCLAVAGCHAETVGTAELSRFRESDLLTGRVLENSTACQVDAICALELLLRDTTITAVYGTGERPAPTCQSPAAVTNEAFGVARGEVVEVVVRTCEDLLRVEHLIRKAATDSAGTGTSGDRDD